MTLARSFAVLCLSVLMTACGGGYEGTPSPTDTSSAALKVDGAVAVTLVPSELKRLEVSGGTRPYSATSSNTSVALASVSDSTLSVAAIRGDLTPISVTVTDAKGAKAAVSVTVTNSPQQGSFSLSSREIALQPGAARTLGITGGSAPFTATSLSPNIATATVSGTALTITGVSEGSNAEIKVFDSKAVTQSVFATVAAPIPSASGLPFTSNMPANLTLRPRNSVTYTLGGGTPPYSVTSTHTAILNPSVRGAALILATGVTGNATVTVTDAVGASLSQRIYVQTTSAPLALSQTAVTGTQYTTADIGITGGMPPYSMVATTTASIASGAVVNGDVLRINMLNAGGPATVTVRDSEGSLANVAVTVTAVLSNLSVSPRAITISELLSSGVATSFPIRIVGGQGPYQVFTSHPNLLVPFVSGDTVIVRTPVTVTGAISPCVDVNTPVSITVIDVTGSSATATVTVADNGPCPLNGPSSSISIFPRAVSISEILGRDANGNAQQTQIGAVVNGGIAPFQVYSSNPTLLSAQLNGSSLLIQTPGTSSAPVAPCVSADTPVLITVVDSAGASSSTTVTVTDQGPCPAAANTTSLEVSPQAVTISELLGSDSAGNLQPTVIRGVLAGGVAPYQVYSSNPTLLTAVLNGTSLTVSTPGTSAAPVIPCVAANAEIIITAIDARGASSTMTVTIADNGLCPR